MGKIKVTKCPIEGLYVIEPAVFGDSRGYFMETYNQKDMFDAGMDMVFVQDNQSMSVKGVAAFDGTAFCAGMCAGGAES